MGFKLSKIRRVIIATINQLRKSTIFGKKKRPTSEEKLSEYISYADVYSEEGFTIDDDISD